MPMQRQSGRSSARYPRENDGEWNDMDSREKGTGTRERKRRVRTRRTPTKKITQRERRSPARQDRSIVTTIPFRLEILGLLSNFYPISTQFLRIFARRDHGQRRISEGSRQWEKWMEVSLVCHRNRVGGRLSSLGAYTGRFFEISPTCRGSSSGRRNGTSYAHA